MLKDKLIDIGIVGIWIVIAGCMLMTIIERNG